MHTKKTRSAVIQMTSTPDVNSNLEKASSLINQAVQDGAQLIVLPECFAYLGPDEQRAPHVENLSKGGPILKHCIQLALEHKVELILGGFWEQAPAARVYNSCIHLDAQGQINAVYRKIHLFDVDLADGTHLRESATVQAGSEAIVTETHFGTTGLSICYDLRFPTLYRKLVEQGATALVIPAAFTDFTGRAHWHTLLRARAIESQCYVLAAAQFGHHYGERHSYGHALICDPWGTILDECTEAEGYAIADLLPERVDEVRKSLPSLQHRKLF